ncbi:hypothetical protein [Candidatus Nitrosocosmicus hydrocola]|nr:hypothetical protein [Candidatus Nitrosocosmicus hydrocola]
MIIRAVYELKEVRSAGFEPACCFKVQTPLLKKTFLSLKARLVSNSFL